MKYQYYERALLEKMLQNLKDLSMMLSIIIACADSNTMGASNSKQ